MPSVRDSFLVFVAVVPMAATPMPSLSPSARAALPTARLGTSLSDAKGSKRSVPQMETTVW